MVNILDCTLRDGGHECNWNFDSDFVKNTISNANAQYFEIGYRNFYETEGKGSFYRCTPEIIKNFQTDKIKLGVMVDTTRFCAQDFPSAKEDFIDFVRIATHPDKISSSLEIAQLLHSRGYKVFVQLMEIPNLKDEHYKILSDWQCKDILESLYIADSYSTVRPEDIEKYFAKLSKFKRISFHAHNGSGLALENTLRAIELGAFCVDVTQNGLGGNLDAKLLK